MPNPKQKRLLNLQSLNSLKIHLCLIVLLGFVVYFNALFAGFIWDDQALIIDNYLIKDCRYLFKIFSTDLFSGSGQVSNFYRPLQSLSLMLDFRLWRLSPIGYHLTNIIFHILNSILVYYFLLNLSKDKRVSLLAGLLFLVHPVNTETVTYISGRADSSMLLFFLAALILWQKSHYALSIIPAALAVLSKETAIIFILVIILYDFYFSSVNFAKRLTKYLPFFIITASYIILRLTILNFVHGPLFACQYSLAVRINTFLKTIFTYFRIIILPFDLHMSRNVILSDSFFVPLVLASFCGLLLIISAAVYFYRRQRIISFAIAWFFINLIPQSGIIPINAFIAEHFIYVSAIGFFIILAYVLKNFVSRRYFIFASVVILIIYSLVTIKRNDEWSHPLVFYEKLVKYSPASFAGYNNLAVIYEQDKRYDLAINAYKDALKIKPDFFEAKINLMRVYYKNGQMQKFNEQAILLLKEYPNSAKVHSILARIYTKAKQYDKAINEFNLAIKYSSAEPGLYNDLGLVYREKGFMDLAIESFQKALALDNTNASYHNNFGVALKAKGRVSEAIEEYLRAVKIEPGIASAWNNLGVIYAGINKLDQAQVLFEKAVKIDPEFTDAYYNLGQVYRQKRLKNH